MALVIGILGGVASGKSLVAGLLAERGAVVLDADAAGHAVLREPDVMLAARERWGAGVFGADGEIDRTALAGIVFADPPHGPDELNFLERLTHPKIGRALREQAERASVDPRVRAVVLDAAVMLEAGWDNFCDKLIFVEAPRDVRLARALTRGWTEQDFSFREAAQENLDTKRTRADLIVDNSGSPESTREQIARFWHAHID